MVAGATHPATAVSVERRHEALVLRLEGKSSEAIGEALGITRQHAWRLVRDALEGRREEIAENTELLRTIEHARYEEYIAALRPAALAGDTNAHRALLRWHERLARLLNLDLGEPEAAGLNVMVIDARAPWERGEPTPQVIEGSVVEDSEEDSDAEG